MSAAPAFAPATPALHRRAPAIDTTLLHRVAAGAVIALAAALRLAGLGGTPVDPFYAGAVRSMGTSWHAFLVGAYDPSAQVAIDKAPLDLWLQVASVKLLGFGPFSLVLPEALGGTLAVAALYDLLNTLAGRRAALAGALALAVLPVAVITSRSHTMDSVMAGLLVLAFAVAARGLRDGRPSRIVVAGALVGVAFEVKLFEALVCLVPLALLWWLGAPGSRARRAQALGLAGLACVALGLAWLVAITLLVPAAQRPWAFGSTNGSAWDSTFAYDGWSRLAGSAAGHGAAAGGAARLPAAPGPLRLLSSQVHLGQRLGVELVLAWLALAAVAALRSWRPLDRAGRAGLLSLVAWLGLGTVLFSAQPGLRPRYLEALDPAIAACLGLGAVLAWDAAAPGLRARGRRPVVVAVALAAAALAQPLVVSAQAIAAHAQDSGTPGALPPSRLAALSRYARGHQGSARYEAAFAGVAEAGGLIARDGRPVLVLTARGHPLVTIRRLAALVRAGELRTAVVGRSRSAVARWIRAHGTDASRAAGQPAAGTVIALRPAPGARSGTRR